MFPFPIKNRNMINKTMKFLMQYLFRKFKMFCVRDSLKLEKYHVRTNDNIQYHLQIYPKFRKAVFI